MMGSEYIDRWNEGVNVSMLESSSKDAPANQTITLTNHCGGVQGGISNGMPIEFRVAFHPVVTLPQPVECLTTDGELRTLQVTGRHDRCQVPRAAVVVEAMAAMVIADYLLVKS
jgi:chorismate synthase